MPGTLTDQERAIERYVHLAIAAITDAARKHPEKLEALGYDPEDIKELATYS